MRQSRRMSDQAISTRNAFAATWEAYDRPNGFGTVMSQLKCNRRSDDTSIYHWSFDSTQAFLTHWIGSVWVIFRNYVTPLGIRSN